MKTIMVVLILAVTNGLWAQPDATISGSLLGYDGKPMMHTDIHIYRGAGQRAAATVHAGTDGTYSLSLRDTGVVTVKFAGLFHLSEDIPFLVEKGAALRVDVRLGTYRYTKDPKQMRLMGTFNKWGQSESQEMSREEGGVFTAEITTTDEKVGYQLIGAETGGRTINGTQSDYYEYDGDGDYRSFVTARDGKVRIIYDPRLVIVSDSLPQITFAEPASRAARYTIVRWKMNQRTKEWSAAYRAFLDAGGEARNFKFQKDRTSELAELASQIRQEQDPMIRPWLLLSYFTDGAEQGDPEVARLFFKVFPDMVRQFPANEVYQLFAPLVSAGQLVGFGQDFKDALLGGVDALSTINTKGSMFYNILSQIQLRKNDEALHEYYGLALEKLADNPMLSMIKSRFSVRKVLVAGKEVPAFRVRSLQDTTIVFSSQMMKGRAYLMDFWATWCSTSIGNMENLHRAYEKYGGRDFEILSLSLDAERDDVRSFRAGKWKMPWLHALVTTNTGLLTDFSVNALPNRCLVDGSGNILATQKDLEEQSLEKILERILGGTK